MLNLLQICSTWAGEQVPLLSCVQVVLALLPHLPLLQGLVLPDQSHAATAFTHAFMRYTILAYVLCLRRLSRAVRAMFPTDEALVAAGLLTEPELGRLQMEGELEQVWWVPLTWSMVLTRE